MRIIRNLSALAVVLVVGTACQSDLTGPTVTPTRTAALITVRKESPAAAPVKTDSAAVGKSNRLKSRYAMAAN